VPSGIVLSFDAKGGKVVTLGFLLSATIVAVCTTHGALAARRRDFVSHRRAMQHVVGQMSVAVTSRALMLGLDAAGIDPNLAYALALWGPVLGSALVVEIVSSRSPFSLANPIHPIERIRREASPLALLVHVRSVVRPLARLGR
jgi:ABC-type Na+ efflux pump permease subunit